MSDTSRYPALLRGSLVVNAVFSGASGLLGVIMPDAIATLLGGVIPSIVLVLGIGLMGFAVIVAWVAYTQPLPAWPVGTIIALDLGWVAGSVVLLATYSALSAMGWWLVLDLAVIVALIAGAQWLGLRRRTPISRRSAMQSA